MKTQRIQNPRFLAALAALGFLGLKATPYPGAQRWAALAWLSLISLLVFVPTVDANGKWANYRLHPRRKWLLAFLGFIGFLGFLGTEYDAFSWLVFLAMTSQFAIDQKDRTKVLPGKGMGEIIIGIVIVITMAVFIAMDLGMIWLAVVLLAGSAALALSPLFGAKDRLPLRELRGILFFVVMAVVLPVGGLFWFMTAAMNNERAAVKQQVDGLYKKQLDMAKQAVDEEWRRWNSVLMQSTNLPPAQRFDALVQTGIADSIAVFCKHGDLKYPRSSISVSEKEFVPNPVAIQMGTEVKTLIRSGSLPEARELLEKMAGDEELRKSVDESGRHILPRLQLFYIQNAPDCDDVLESLRAFALNYQTGMPSDQRLFLLQALAERGVDVEPWLGAELLALEEEVLLSNANAQELPWSSSRKSTVGELVFMQLSADRQVIGLNCIDSWGRRMQRCVDALPMMEDVRIAVELPDYSQKEKPRMRGAMIGPGFVLSLYVDGDGSLRQETGRRVLVYFFTGIGLVVVISIAAALLVRSLLAQQRLTRMKNDFVATVTHELKTPLASTRMLVDTLLEGRCKSETQQREYLELIARENKRLSRLIDNFLTFSRMERNKRTLDFEDVSPAELAQAAAETVHENFERCGCKLSVDIAQDLPPIVADLDSMVQVLLNLLDNACKYSDGDKRIALRVFEREHAVCFEVADRGIGMTPREQAKIFDRFYQVDQSMTRKVGGAGLGLSIVKFIVDAHGAKIDIESELGKGSVFMVSIPLNGVS